MNKEQQQSLKSNKSGSKAGAKAARPPATERASLPEERAEGEGMIAPTPDAAKGKAKGEASELEGEGSYTATRRYDEGVARSVAKGDTDKLAHEAEKALDGPEGDELREAEKAAKQGHTR